MHQNAKLLVWSSHKLRRLFGRKFWGKLTVRKSIWLSPVSTLLETLHVRDFLKVQSGLPTDSFDWFMKGWKYLNRRISDKSNWQALTGQEYRKRRTTDLFYRRSMAQTTMELSSVLKTRTKIHVIVGMPKK